MWHFLLSESSLLLMFPLLFVQFRMDCVFIACLHARDVEQFWLNEIGTDKKMYIAGNGCFVIFLFVVILIHPIFLLAACKLSSYFRKMVKAIHSFRVIRFDLRISWAVFLNGNLFKPTPNSSFSTRQRALMSRVSRNEGNPSEVRSVDEKHKWIHMKYKMELNSFLISMLLLRSNQITIK